MVVPTLALVDEYNKKIIKKYSSVFQDYKVILTLNESSTFNFDQKNIFILTHDRIIEGVNFNLLKKIDLLVIDEVYKLQRDEFNDRILILNLAYYYLSKIATKYILLAPFVSGIERLGNLEKPPIFHRTNFSPVVNEVRTYEITSNNDRNSRTIEI